MAGYVKVWTAIKSNESFLGLSLTQRGAWYEILMAAKIQRDDGTVFYRNQAAMGHDWGCEGKTAGKILGILQDFSLLTYTKNDKGGIGIEIPNYRYWQDLDVKTLVEKSRKNPRKIPPLRPDQTRPDQTNIYSQVIEHLNMLTGKKYRWQSPKTQSHISARLSEGYQLDDFIYVNQVKAEEWLNGEMEKYLRPSTLYSPKFEDYRNQRRIPRQYSDKTNKALAAAAQYLKNEGLLNATTGQEEISSSPLEITGSVS